MTGRRSRDLEKWMTSAASDAPAPTSFLTGLRSDQDAVTAGLTLPWSSGAVEGHVSRIKMLKRQMYGRVSPDLLVAASSSPTNATAPITQSVPEPFLQASPTQICCGCGLPARGIAVAPGCRRLSRRLEVRSADGLSRRAGPGRSRIHRSRRAPGRVARAWPGSG
jgi:hypothetical protein